MRFNRAARRYNQELVRGNANCALLDVYIDEVDYDYVAFSERTDLDEGTRELLNS